MFYTVHFVLDTEFRIICYLVTQPQLIVTSSYNTTPFPKMKRVSNPYIYFSIFLFDSEQKETEKDTYYLI